MKDIVNTIEKIIRCPINTLEELCNIANLDPLSSFRDRNLTHIDFGSSGLSGFSFFGSDLSYSNLTKCKIPKGFSFEGCTTTFTTFPPSFAGSPVLGKTALIYVGMDDSQIALTNDLLSPYESLITTIRADDSDIQYIFEQILDRATALYDIDFKISHIVVFTPMNTIRPILEQLVRRHFRNRESIGATVQLVVRLANRRGRQYIIHRGGAKPTLVQDKGAAEQKLLALIARASDDYIDT